MAVMKASSMSPPGGRDKMVNADDPFGFRIPDIWDLEPIEGPRRRRNGKKKNAGPKRSTKRVGPGHTIVTYDHRTLHYRFKQSRADFEKAKAARRRKANKGSSRGPRSANAIYINKDGSYSSSTGRDVSLSARSQSDRGMSAIRRKNIARDDYDIDDMRALLNDARWEEVCGHKRWKYDAQSTVKEYNKYLKYHGKR